MLYNASFGRSHFSIYNMYSHQETTNQMFQMVTYVEAKSKYEKSKRAQIYRKFKDQIVSLKNVQIWGN